MTMTTLPPRDPASNGAVQADEALDLVGLGVSIAAALLSLVTFGASSAASKVADAALKASKAAEAAKSMGDMAQITSTTAEVVKTAEVATQATQVAKTLDGVNKGVKVVDMGVKVVSSVVKAGVAYQREDARGGITSAGRAVQTGVNGVEFVARESSSGHSTVEASSTA